MEARLVDVASVFGWGRYSGYSQNRLSHFRDFLGVVSKPGLDPKQVAALWLFVTSTQRGKGGDPARGRNGNPDVIAAAHVWWKGWPPEPQWIRWHESGVVTILAAMPPELEAGLIELFGAEGPRLATQLCCWGAPLVRCDA